MEAHLTKIISPVQSETQYVKFEKGKITQDESKRTPRDY
jgi:hypothetical protein